MSSTFKVYITDIHFYSKNSKDSLYCTKKSPFENGDKVISKNCYRYLFNKQCFF